MPWVSITYHPASFFSLRPAQVTSSGGKTLLCPTAFAIKMALLNASIQRAGIEEGKRRFNAIRDLRIALALPQSITVLKSFAKIRRPVEFKDAKTREEKIVSLSAKGQYPFQSTIAYREFIQFGNPVQSLDACTLQIACSPVTGDTPHWLGETLLAINYLGKRGGFVQPLTRPLLLDTVSSPFVEITRDSDEVLLDGTLQMLDDCGPALTFDHADIYSTKRIGLGRERLLRHVVLPYRLSRSSRGYSLYIYSGERGG